MNVATATARYERWIRSQVPLIRGDLERKHREMAADRFPFLRATYYRWAQIWAEHAGRLAGAPRILSVGDLHVENFGTWRDADGRLVWGVNDFDEADELPFAADLLRLAVSAVIAVRDGDRPLSAKQAVAAILDGYRHGLENGGEPFVLEERHPALRSIAEARLKDQETFWSKLAESPPNREPLPRPARRMLKRLLPKGAARVRVVHRAAGLGSLGRRRFTATAELSGGLIAREVKELVSAASVWARGGDSRQIHYARILRSAVRCPDPFLVYRKGWAGRRYSPSNNRIELRYLPAADVETVLRCMGTETANIHLGGKDRRGIRAALARVKATEVVKAVRALERAVSQDWKYWQRR